MIETNADPKFTYIRGKCIQANPEINELQFGARLILKESPQLGIGLYICPILDSFMPEPEHLALFFENSCPQTKHKPIEAFTVLGRSIGLADVLHTIHSFTGATTVDKLTNCSYVSSNLWNLKSDELALQSAECIDFIFKLLK